MKIIELENFTSTHQQRITKNLSMRIVIPSSLRQQIISLAHQGHLCIIKAKQQLRSKCFWFQMDKEIETAINNCQQCQRVSRPNHPPPINRIELL